MKRRMWGWFFLGALLSVLPYVARSAEFELGPDVGKYSAIPRTSFVLDVPEKSAGSLPVVFAGLRLGSKSSATFTIGTTHGIASTNLANGDWGMVSPDSPAVADIRRQKIADMTGFGGGWGALFGWKKNYGLRYYMDRKQKELIRVEEERNMLNKSRIMFRFQVFN